MFRIGLYVWILLLVLGNVYRSTQALSAPAAHGGHLIHVEEYADHRRKLSRQLLAIPRSAGSDEPRVAANPKVALLFLLGDATSPNWPTWAAFFEMAAKLQLNPEAAVRAGEVLREVTKVSVQDATGSSQLLHPPLQPYPHLDNYTFHQLQQGLPVAPESMQLLLPKRRKLHNSSTTAASLGGKHFPCLEELAMQQQQTHQDINMRSSQSPDAKTRAFSNLHDHTLSDPQSRASSACVHPMIQKQHLFSVYVHTPPGLLLPQGSLFSGCVLDKRSNTANAYAQYPLMDAALLLLQAALENKANTKFVLVGEASIPLYPSQVIWAQLLSEGKSRINACTKAPHATFFKNRWNFNMTTTHFNSSHWRVSSQWFVLNRAHAMLAVEDLHVKEVFRRYCHTTRWRVCVSDEHYLASLLASYGLEDQTDCLGKAHYVDWSKARGTHPTTFTATQITPQFVQLMRGDTSNSQNTCRPLSRGLIKQSTATGSMCDATNAIVSAVYRVFDSSTHGPTQDSGFNSSYSSIDGTVANRVDTHTWLIRLGYKPLQASCPLFARKFPANIANDTLQMALSCAGLQLGHWCYRSDTNISEVLAK